VDFKSSPQISKDPWQADFFAVTENVALQTLTNSGPGKRTAKLWRVVVRVCPYPNFDGFTMVWRNYPEVSFR
jgi:hypothetical protein